MTLAAAAAVDVMSLEIVLVTITSKRLHDISPKRKNRNIVDRVVLIQDVAKLFDCDV
jgi:hypothetical protein